MRPLITELNRRNVTRVATAYALVGWIFIEAGSVLLPTFGAPDWVFKAWVIVVIAGFVASVILAWVYELTPEGIKLEKDIDRSQSIAGKTGRKLNGAIIALLIVALGVSISFNVVGLRGGPHAGVTGADHQSIAVLPFDSRSADPDNVFFADGIHGDLLSTLADIGALKVISRTSVMEYRDTRKNLREIASELGVGTVLEGAVQKAGDNVRINVQLIDAATDQSLWSETYDRALTTRNIFAIQSEISAEIARALRTTLTPQEQTRIASVDTDNLEAYNLVQAGRSGLYQRRFETMQQAKVQFERAIELDPTYAQAYIGLANSMMLLLINHQVLPARDVLAGAGAALDTALAIDPQDADAYASLGLLRLTQSEQGLDQALGDAAEAAFKRAIELSPNHVQARMWYASQFDARGDTVAAMQLYERAMELDPLARIPRLNLAGMYAKLGENDKALDIWLSAVQLHPDWPTPYQRIANHLDRSGRVDEALAWATKGRELSSDPLVGANLITIYLELGDTEGAMQVFAGVSPEHPFYAVMHAAQLLIGGDFQAAHREVRAWLAHAPQRPQDILGFAYVTAMYSGDLEMARDYLTEMAPDLSEQKIGPLDTDSIGYAVALGYLQQRLGEPERAAYLLEQVYQATRSMPRLGLAGYGAADIQALALLGRGDEAVAALQSAVAEGLVGTAAFNFWRLNEDPLMESIREWSRFQAIVRELDAKIDAMRRRADAARASGDWDALLSLAGSQRIAARSP